jgi:N-acyl homoserine lactone hydrolase
MKMTHLCTLLLASWSLGCAVTSHGSTRSKLGVARSAAELLAVVDQPGVATVETVASADWKVDRSGLINLDDPRAKAAQLTDGLEPIQIYFHVIRHPTQGMFLVDTGVERAMRDHPERAAIRGIVASYMHLERMAFPAVLGDWLAAKGETPRGVLLTHLHTDHITGMVDVPAGTPVYVGPGEGRAHGLLNMFTQGATDRALEGKPALEELPFASDASGRFDGVLDLFGDGSVWALWVPGHTPGSVAYLVRTPSGPVLLTGDTCHTRWGWDHGVEPGSYTADQPRNRTNLLRLKRLVAEHPSIDARLGHQR